MKSWRHNFIGMVCLVLGFLAAWQALPTWAKGSPPPQSKPAVMEFGRGICPKCKEMEGIIKNLQARYGDRVELKLLYVDRDEPLFDKYKVMLVPTQVFLDAGGNEVSRHIGLFPEAELVQKLKELKFIQE